MKLVLSDIAKLVDGSLKGDTDICISGANSIEDAGPGDISFVRGKKYWPLLKHTKASAILAKEIPDTCNLPHVLVNNPDMAFAKILALLESHQRNHPTGVHPDALIGKNVVLGTNVAIDAFVRIGDNCTIGNNTVLYSGVYIGSNSTVGSDSILYPNVVVREHCRIGARCILHSGACIGSDGFGFAYLDGTWAKIPQVGIVIIEDDVEVGSNSAIDRATCGITRIGQGTKIDNLVQIGHNTQIGAHCAIAGMVGIAGSAKIGDNVRIGAYAGVAGHITIGDGATIGARSGVSQSVDPGVIVSGFPVKDHQLERRIMVSQAKIPDLIRRMRELEIQLKKLEEEKGLHG